MKKSLIKNDFKTISRTRRRFISILVMAFLGVGFYSGLAATSPDMLDSLDRYADSSKLYDISITSPLGLTNQDLEEVSNLSEIKEVYGIQTKDSIAKLEENESVCRIIEYDENINIPYLVSGRLPENSNECLLDHRYSLSEDAETYIGKTIFLENNDVDYNGDAILTQKELKVVGIVNSPLYISSERGNSLEGSGKVSFYIYVKDDVINLSYYSQIYATINGAKEMVTNSNEYLDLVESVTKKLERDNWYVEDRLENTGYSNIFDAIKTMSNISKLFPVIFYIVAVLISLTSMTRMIEEERIEIGTLKSLGYTNIQIILKYLLYAFLVCIIGGIIGMMIGFYLLPNLVWTLYSIIYTIPEFYISCHMEIGIKGILIAFLCIGGATIAVAYKELQEMPSVLMRPKAPKRGKKILLERITFIWKKLNFSKKVTIRNIFRYKKRAIMTIVGIAGCTGLMLTGFGIRDSVIDIPSLQYGGIFKYDATISLLNNEKIADIESYLDSNKNVENYVEMCAGSGKLEGNNSSYNVTIFVPSEKEKIETICNLEDSSSHQKISLSDNGVIITNKVAEFLNVSVGDEVTLITSNNAKHNLRVDGITVNYVSHYVYMSKEFYESNINPYSTNMIFINEVDTDTNKINAMSEELLNYQGVTAVTNVSDLVKSISDMLTTMNYVVVILIVASALLAFVVLYNLANINIGERQREIATLKVLGFFDKEVDNYINKENIIFTIVGIVIGLIFGTFLTNAVVASVEIENLRFVRNINPLSYVYSAAITFLFSVIVNKIIHYVLKKIDMIESLKSVE